VPDPKEAHPQLSPGTILTNPSEFDLLSHPMFRGSRSQRSSLSLRPESFSLDSVQDPHPGGSGLLTPQEGHHERETSPVDRWQMECRA
jgi:hypothetical protein